MSPLSLWWLTVSWDCAGAAQVHVLSSWLPQTDPHKIILENMVLWMHR